MFRQENLHNIQPTTGSKMHRLKLTQTDQNQHPPLTYIPLKIPDHHHHHPNKQTHHYPKTNKTIFNKEKKNQPKNFCPNNL